MFFTDIFPLTPELLKSSVRKSIYYLVFHMIYCIFAHTKPNYYADKLPPFGSYP